MNNIYSGCIRSTNVVGSMENIVVVPILYASI